MSQDAQAPLLILVLGVSGAGKNVALGALEDLGFAVINNLPCQLLVPAVSALQARAARSIAIAVNGQDSELRACFDRSHAELARQYGPDRLLVLQLDASDDVLIKRYAETRRKHPFADDQHTLLEAIRDERERLRVLPGRVVQMDTSATSAHALRQRVRALAMALAGGDPRPLLAVSSFAYRAGIPQDADLVFDARILPNPFYVEGLAELTGRDAPVIEFLQRQPESARLVEGIVAFIEAQMPGFIQDNRTRVHVAIGCTGGKHRSVFVADAVARAMADRYPVSRHDREHPQSE